MKSQFVRQELISTPSAVTNDLVNEISPREISRCSDGVEESFIPEFAESIIESQM